MTYRSSWSRDLDRVKDRPLVKVESADKEAILSRIRDILEGDNRILLAVVFGSFTRHNTIRDIDLAVYMVGFTDAFDVLEDCEELSSKLSSIIGIPVDVVLLQYSRDSVFNEALIHGTPIIIRDPRLYEALRLLALDQYKWITSKTLTLI
ncbi:MAG: nucleotidyltransferase domain-containing protein [Desulfurococcales archaeon]|nr:nucleotidyltransferase domain-containing protein [Desulfurococcales archaeon]